MRHLLMALVLVFMFFTVLYLFNILSKRKKCSKLLAFVAAFVASCFFSGLLIEALYGLGLVK